MDEPEFEFQKLEVYQRALELMAVIREIIRQLPAGSGDLISQVKRHERSIRLNIAEGSGKHRPGGKVERYRTAPGVRERMRGRPRRDQPVRARGPAADAPCHASHPSDHRHALEAHHALGSLTAPCAPVFCP